MRIMIAVVAVMIVSVLSIALIGSPEALGGNKLEATVNETPR